MISTIYGKQSDEIMDLCNLIYDNVWFQKISITPPPLGGQGQIGQNFQGVVGEHT